MRSAPTVLLTMWRTTVRGPTSIHIRDPLRPQKPCVSFFMTSRLPMIGTKIAIAMLAAANAVNLAAVEGHVSDPDLLKVPLRCEAWPLFARTCQLQGNNSHS